MSKKLKILLTSCIAVALSAAILAIGVMALFSDSRKVTNHLQAGSLQIKLERTRLDTTTLTSEGLFDTKTDTKVVEFTNGTSENVFGITSDMKIAPCASFTARMKISHATGSTIAFRFWAEVTGNTDNALAEQLTITVTRVDKDGVQIPGSVPITKTLQEGLTLGSEVSPIDTVKIGGEAYFEVKLSFGNIDNSENNKAQDMTANFDLLVKAVQVEA